MILYTDNKFLMFAGNGAQEHHVASTRFWKPLPRCTWQLVINSMNFIRLQDQWETPGVLQLQDLYP